MAQGEHARSRRGWLRVAILLAAVVGLAVAAKFLPVKDYAERLLGWVDDLGMWGPATVVVIYIVACVFMLPGSILTLGAGFLFGVVEGTATVSIASTLGACAAFLVGRTIARGWVSGKVAGNAKFAAVDEAVGRQGFKIVLLTRLSPVFPFNLLKVHVRKGTDKILGATLVAPHAGEMISEITLAMAGNLGLGAIGGVIHPYPTQAEAIKQAGDAYNRTRLTPFVKKLFAGILKWTR